MACGGLSNNIQIREQTTGFTYNGTGIRQRNVADPLIMRASTSYLTGQHNYKAGFNLLMTRKYEDYRERGASLALPVTYTFNGGVPRSLTEFVTPRVNPAMVRPNLGIFFQDQWNLKRVTLNYGIRYEYLRAYAAAVTEPAGFPSNAVADYPQVDCLPCWHDLNPRFALAWDLFGTGKTAVKAGFGRYVESLNSAYATTFGPSGAIVLSTTRSWTDTNRDFMPNCDLANTGINGECGAMANSSFGQLQYNTVPDAGFMTGFGKRQLQLAGIGRCRPRAAARHRHQHGVLSPLVRQLYRHRQHPRDAGRLQPVLRRRSDRLAARVGQRLADLRAV